MGAVRNMNSGNDSILTTFLAAYGALRFLRGSVGDNPQLLSEVGQIKLPMHNMASHDPALQSPEVPDQFELPKRLRDER